MQTRQTSEQEKEKQSRFHFFASEVEQSASESQESDEESDMGDDDESETLPCTHCKKMETAVDTMLKAVDELRSSVKDLVEKQNAHVTRMEGDMFIVRELSRRCIEKSDQSIAAMRTEMAIDRRTFMQILSKHIQDMEKGQYCTEKNVSVLADATRKLVERYEPPLKRARRSIDSDETVGVGNA